MSFLTDQTNREIFESLYHLAGILLAVGLLLSAYQLFLFRRDSAIRNKRSAAEKAIEYASRYLTRYVALDGVHCKDLEEAGLASYDGPIGDFNAESLPEDLKAKALARFGMSSWLAPMNELLVISSAFTSGAADEEIGFNIIGRTFCHSVESEYDLLCFSRNNSPCDYFQAIIDLYKLWSPRMRTHELEHERDQISAKLTDIPKSQITPIGCD